MTYCFDIDGTLCTNTDGNYANARPFPDAIARVNGLFEGGHRILLYTARGATTGIDWRELTERQVRAWGVKHHGLFMGKPTADVYVDDKGMNSRDWERQNLFRNPAYLDVTYSEDRAPYGEYPFLLSKWILDNVYHHPGRLLDLGCGRGEALAGFARLGFDVAGVDVSPRALQLAKGFRVEVADLERESLPFPAASFDFVFSKSIIEHMRQPVSLLTKAASVLKPGGTAVVMTPSWEYQHWGPFYVDHTHVTPFTAPALADAMTFAGFEAVTVSYFRQLPFLWRYPFLRPLVWMTEKLPLTYRPFHASAAWPDGINKLIRFSKEVMLLAVGRKPGG